MKGPYFPTEELLHSSAPLSIWEEAKKQALRSPMIRFRMGAVIFDERGAIISKGTSHPDIERYKISCSIHAELHALRRSYRGDLEGAQIVIVALNKIGGFAYCARPCYSCAKNLYSREIERVIYPERDEDNSWIIRSEHPGELIARAVPTINGFARGQRIPAPI